MKGLGTMIRIDIRLAFRQRVVIFFNYLMPLIFFFTFAQAFHAEQGGVILQVVTMVTVIGILGNGLLGAGIRAAQDREMNILRRYKVAPINALPLLIASTITGLVVYMPFVVLMFLLAKWRYGFVLPQHIVSVLIFIALGVTALRALGLIVASVANSMQESGIMVQILYMAMLFLSGTTFPTAMFPNWLLVATQFIPATWLVTGMQGMMLRNETLVANWQAVGAMVLTTAVGLFLAVKLFRWEKEEKVRPAAKLWVLAVLLPFVMLGSWQAYTKDNVRKTKIVERDLARSRTVLIRGARIFVGDGRVIENGGVLVANGKIAEVFDGNVPDAKVLHAEAIEAAGKTVLPGLIDTRVNLPSQRDLAAYLYCGVTAVNTNDRSDEAVKMRDLVASGEKQGAELFLVDVAKEPSLSELDAMQQFGEGKTDLLNDSLVQQVSQPEFLDAVRKRIATGIRAESGYARPNILAMYPHGIATDAGQPLVFVGPSVQHEMELWVATGFPAADALRAATLNGAKELHAEDRIGSIERGKDATMVIVDGNPLQDIKATEAISSVIFRGERVDRGDLLKPE